MSSSSGKASEHVSGLPFAGQEDRARASSGHRGGAAHRGCPLAHGSAAPRRKSQLAGWAVHRREQLKGLHRRGGCRDPLLLLPVSSLPVPRPGEDTEMLSAQVPKGTTNRRARDKQLRTHWTGAWPHCTQSVTSSFLQVPPQLSHQGAVRVKTRTRGRGTQAGEVPWGLCLLGDRCVTSDTGMGKGFRPAAGRAEPHGGRRLRQALGFCQQAIPGVHTAAHLCRPQSPGHLEATSEPPGLSSDRVQSRRTEQLEQLGTSPCGHLPWSREGRARRWARTQQHLLCPGLCHGRETPEREPLTRCGSGQPLPMACAKRAAPRRKKGAPEGTGLSSLSRHGERPGCWGRGPLS